MKIGLVVASLALVAGGVTGCSNDASKEDFCAGYEDFISAVFKVQADDKDYVEKLKDAAAEFEDVGTPGDIPDDAAEGRELVLKAIEDIDDDATPEDIADLESDFSEDEQKKADAFEEYLSKTCPDAGESLTE